MKLLLHYEVVGDLEAVFVADLFSKSAGILYPSNLFGNLLCDTNGVKMYMLDRRMSKLLFGLFFFFPFYFFSLRIEDTCSKEVEFFTHCGISYTDYAKLELKPYKPSSQLFRKWFSKKLFKFLQY